MKFPRKVSHGTVQHEKMPVEDFIFRMLDLGRPLELALVGAFEADGIGSRRDIDLPLHKDGVYSRELADAQGGVILQRSDIDFVGLYCIRDGNGKCETTFSTNDEFVEGAVELKRGEALIIDNRKVFHGRTGSVGDRLLLRLWVSAK
jgi:hypothetical protein